MCIFSISLNHALGPANGRSHSQYSRILQMTAKLLNEIRDISFPKLSLLLKKNLKLANTYALCKREGVHFIHILFPIEFQQFRRICQEFLRHQ